MSAWKSALVRSAPIWLLRRKISRARFATSRIAVRSRASRGASSSAGFTFFAKFVAAKASSGFSGRASRARRFASSASGPRTEPPTISKSMPSLSRSRSLSFCALLKKYLFQTFSTSADKSAMSLFSSLVMFRFSWARRRMSRSIFVRLLGLLTSCHKRSTELAMLSSVWIASGLPVIRLTKRIHQRSIVRGSKLPRRF